MVLLIFSSLTKNCKWKGSDYDVKVNLKIIQFCIAKGK